MRHVLHVITYLRLALLVAATWEHASLAGPALTAGAHALSGLEYLLKQLVDRREKNRDQDTVR